MKKLFKKRIIIPVLVVVVMAVAASVAYAWWTTDTSIDGNEVTTGSMGMSSGSSPIVAKDLIPQLAPGTDLSKYHVSYFWFKNTSPSTPMMAYGYLDNVVDPTGIQGKVMVQITIAPTDSPWGDPTGTLSAAGGPYPVYTGSVDGIMGTTNGKATLATRFWTGTAWQHTLLAPGQEAWYKVVVWLDSSADNSYQNGSFKADLKFNGMQEEAWVD